MLDINKKQLEQLLGQLKKKIIVDGIGDPIALSDTGTGFPYVGAFELQRYLKFLDIDSFVFPYDFPQGLYIPEFQIIFQPKSEELWIKDGIVDQARFFSIQKMGEFVQKEISSFEAMFALLRPYRTEAEKADFEEEYQITIYFSDPSGKINPQEIFFPGKIEVEVMGQSTSMARFSLNKSSSSRVSILLQFLARRKNVLRAFGQYELAEILKQETPREWGLSWSPDGRDIRESARSLSQKCPAFKRPLHSGPGYGLAARVEWIRK